MSKKGSEIDQKVIGNLHNYFVPDISWLIIEYCPSSILTGPTIGQQAVTVSQAVANFLSCVYPQQSADKYHITFCLFADPRDFHKVAIFIESFGQMNYGCLKCLHMRGYLECKQCTQDTVEAENADISIYYDGKSHLYEDFEYVDTYESRFRVGVMNMLVPSLSQILSDFHHAFPNCRIESTEIAISCGIPVCTDAASTKI
jgi:hypothetical protein